MEMINFREFLALKPTLIPFLFFLFLFAILGFELRAYTLSYSISPFFL
jgi:hypothetical protein